MSDARISECILDLAAQQHSSNNVDKKPHVVYLGTATYDIPLFFEKQTQRFVNQSCRVTQLKLVHEIQPDWKKVLDSADIIVVSGGNTLYAVDRWRRLGVDQHLQAAVERGAVLAGGSAGAICWFDGGHSDSMDPDSFLPAMMGEYGNDNDNDNNNKDDAVEENKGAPTINEEVKDWRYIRVPGLGFLPGLLCPHHDQVQSNGVLRAHDFDNMLLTRHPGEVGIGLDHWCALVVDGNDSYRVVSLEGKTGSVLYNDDDPNPIFSAEAKGAPGIWIKRVVNGKVTSTLLPPTGNLSDYLSPATSIELGLESLQQCRDQNPDVSPLS